MFTDLYFPSIDWQSGSPGRDILKVVLDGFWSEDVLFPTCKANCLALVTFSAESNMVKNFSDSGKVRFSNHDLINFNLCYCSSSDCTDEVALDLVRLILGR